MIAYFDSSSLVKWFFDEPHVDLSRDIRDGASLSFTSLVSFPEVMSAINRAGKEGPCSKAEMEIAKSEFLKTWPNLVSLTIDESLIRQAGQLIFTHNLRGGDAVHLASALLLEEEGSDLDIFFSSFDKNLNRAAKKEGLSVHHDF